MTALMPDVWAADISAGSLAAPDSAGPRTASDSAEAAAQTLAIYTGELAQLPAQDWCVDCEGPVDIVDEDHRVDDVRTGALASIYFLSCGHAVCP